MSTRKLIGEENIPEPGKYLSVISLFSSYGGGLIRNNGDRVGVGETLEGKHVMVCCFDVPVLDYCETPVQSVVNLCKELYWTRKEKEDFEMVVVTRMKDDDDEEGFDHLLSAFPESCLAVPFEDQKRHQYVCSALNLRSRVSFKCVFVNADGKVCPFFSDMNPLGVEIFRYYGAEAFPFTEEVLKKRMEEYQRLVSEEPSSLEAVLQCNDASPAYVYKFGNGEERMHISQLSNGGNKHVGVLLCCKGGLIPHLVRSYEQCRERGLDFEVVVVYTPFSFFKDTDPAVFKEEMDGVMREHMSTCRRWWCLPFDNSVSRRFWRMSNFYCRCFHRCECDKFVMVGPGVGRPVDRFGGEMVRCYGADAYPFTTEAAIANKMKKLRECTLESLFAGASVYRGTDKGRRVVPVGELTANKVFLLMEELKGVCDLKALVPVYHEMKERFGYEVIFVEVGEDTMPGLLPHSEPVPDEERWEILSEMPWYICPPNKPLTDWYGQNFLTLFGFGDDGRLCSIPFLGLTISLQDFTSGTLYDQVQSLILNPEG